MHYIHMHEIASANAVHKTPKIQWIAKLQAVMLSPIKTTPLPLLFFFGECGCYWVCGRQRHLSQIAINPQTHIHTHTPPPQSPLQLSNVKAVTQLNKSQTRSGLGSLPAFRAIGQMRQWQLLPCFALAPIRAGAPRTSSQYVLNWRPERYVSEPIWRRPVGPRIQLGIVKDGALLGGNSPRRLALVD